MKKNRLPYFLIFLLAIWCLTLSIVLYNKYDDSQETELVNEYNVTGFSTDFTKIVQKDSPAIVSVVCDGSVSSGFVYKQVDNIVYIVTSYHGVTGDYIYVSFDNVYNAHAKLVDKNIYADVAVISIESNYIINPLTLSDATLLNDGEFVVCIGTPVSLDYDGSVELGMISNSNLVIENSITVDETTKNYYLDVIQLSSNLKPGYSGSPILNMNGDVVGMITMSKTDGVNFAITANEIKIIADNIIAGNEFKKYQTGIKGSYIANMATYVKSNLNLPISLISGLYVEKVMDNSIGSYATLSKGDVILSINGIEINDLNNYLNAVYTKSDYLEFKVLRGENTLTLTVNLND